MKLSSTKYSDYTHIGLLMPEMIINIFVCSLEYCVQKKVPNIYKTLKKQAHWLHETDGMIGITFYAN